MIPKSFIPVHIIQTGLAVEKEMDTPFHFSPVMCLPRCISS